MFDESKNLPAVTDEYGLSSDRILVGERFKWNSETSWIAFGEPVAKERRLLALACRDLLQMWHEQKVIETITEKPFPDLDELNARTPEADWETDLSGKPKPPWVHAWAAYFLDPQSGDRFTYINSTFGARIAVQQLKDRTSSMRLLRGANVVPVVTLSQKPMHTRFGVKSRPDFLIADWVLLGGNKPLQAAPTLALTKAPAPTLKEEFSDEIPW